MLLMEELYINFTCSFDFLSMILVDNQMPPVGTMALYLVLLVFLIEYESKRYIIFAVRLGLTFLIHHPYGHLC